MRLAISADRPNGPYFAKNQIFLSKIVENQIFIKWPEMQSATKKVSQNVLLAQEIRFDTMYVSIHLLEPQV